MSKSFDKKQIGLAIACSLTLGILSGTVGAQNVTPPDGPDAKNRLYVEDNRGAVVGSGFGLCWHSGFGPPPAPNARCEAIPVAFVATPSVPVPPPAMEPPKVVAAPPPQVSEPPKVYEPPKRPARRDRN